MHSDFLKQEKKETKTMLHFNVKPHFCLCMPDFPRIVPFRDYNGVLIQVFGDHL